MSAKKDEPLFLTSGGPATYVPPEPDRDLIIEAIYRALARHDHERRRLVEHRIAAIEREAVARERARLRAAVEAMYHSRHVLGFREGTAWVRKAAVLALLADEASR